MYTHILEHISGNEVLDCQYQNYCQNILKIGLFVKNFFENIYLLPALYVASGLCTFLLFCRRSFQVGLAFGIYKSEHRKCPLFYERHVINFS